jgi:S1-C subfamily serine protease
MSDNDSETGGWAPRLGSRGWYLSATEQAGHWDPGPTPPVPPQAQARRRSRRAVPSLLTAALVAAGGLAGVAFGHDVWRSTTTIGTAAGITGSGGSSPPGGSTYGQSPVPSNGSSGSSSDGSSSSSGSSGGATASEAAAVAARVAPALVDVNSTFAYQSAQGAGTGIVLTSSGEVLTNNHVIDGATKISVTDIGNGRTYTAKVVGYDATHDVAVLQLKGASGLATAKLGSGSSAGVGESVVAIGNAGGTGGTPSDAGGSITALDQSITASDDLDGTSEQLSGLIQVNADIQPGDSGGSLVNTSGQVIGMDTAASEGFSFQSSSGTAATEGFAIPIDEALSIVQKIESGQGSTTAHVGPTAFLGVLISASGQQSGSGGYYGYGSGSPGGSSTSGVSIESVVSGGSADAAGLAAGDVITSLDGQAISSSSDLSSILVAFHPGDRIQVGWVDTSGQSQAATVTLASGPPA